MTIVVGGILLLRLHAFLALILGALVVAALSSHEASAMGRVTAALGAGFSNLAILISMAVIIGRCLLDSGAAERIVRSLRRLLGEKRTPVALSASAFVLGVPVFFDTVFYLLMPLGKALRTRTGRDYVLYILAIVCGATMAHSLVPPTPGPLYVASELGVDVGTMILAGLVVGPMTVTAGYAYAVWANARWTIPLRDMEGSVAPNQPTSVEDSERRLPGLGWSLLPIVLPVVLIGSQTIAQAFGFHSEILAVVGDKNLALILAAAVSLVLLAVSQKRSAKELAVAVQSALAGGGVILLITSAGSAFGAMLRDTGIAEVVAAWVPEQESLAWIPMAFLLTAAVRTAQGSATVAMITAIGIVAPVVGAVDLAYHPVYIALAIGCGSKPIMWANDSGFWIIGRVSGMTPMETFKTASMQMLVMAGVGLVVVLIGARFLPLKPGI